MPPLPSFDSLFSQVIESEQAQGHHAFSDRQSGAQTIPARIPPFAFGSSIPCGSSIIKNTFQPVIPSSASPCNNRKPLSAVIHPCGTEWLTSSNCTKFGTFESRKRHHLGCTKKLRLCHSCFPTLSSNAGPRVSHAVFRNCQHQHQLSVIPFAVSSSPSLAQSYHPSEAIFDASDVSISRAGERLICSNCAAIKTPLWRRDGQNNLICNACGLYLRKHHSPRPVFKRG